ncbi:carbohydrate kinase family protein [Mariniflexile sp. HMF6888]|uniref:carbohydrate kinase family protein n=1 Tax=Mariniflexile sp. HMF6888 TaxID=3373086 RepID=UPI0037AC4F57
MFKKKIIVVGELNVDLILNTIHGFPSVGKEIVAENFDFVLGSSSAIMASNLAALGVQTDFCGIIGDDLYGNFILQQLNKKNVNTRFIKINKNQKTGVTVILNYGEDRANITFCGTMELLTMHDIPWSALNHHKHMHISSVFLQAKLKENILDIFQKAKKIGLTTSLDIQWDPSEQWDFNYKTCLPYVDVFMPNKQELLSLTKSTCLEDSINEIKPYSNCIVIKLGKEGCIGIHGKKKITMPAFKNPEHVDSIGAGDSFNSGFIKKYLEDAPLEECLRFGNLIGAVSTTSAGGTAAFENKTSLNNKIKNFQKSNLNSQE